mmetsp:Transcript_64307/g.139965  ORF Transcript_64307/g.139965 Transcript_64307/m.139965 type:complete len:722 (+) Transcript_64307:147-2312(+)
MAAAASAQVKRVRRTLEQELPTIPFDDEVVTHFSTILDGDVPLSEETLYENWSPFLISQSACCDEEEARLVCRSLLARLRSEDGSGSTTASDVDGGPSTAAQAQAAAAVTEVPAGETAMKELIEWMEALRLTSYTDAAKAWCERMGAAHLGEVVENWEDFANELKLKPLERKRVEKDVASRSSAPPEIMTPSSKSPASAAGTPKPAGTPAAVATSPVPAASPSAASKPVERRPGFFGPPEDPQMYTIHQELGTGATATVHKCSKGDEFFAVKTISLAKLKLQPNYEFISSKLHNEVSILFSLRHDRIVTLFDVVEESDALRLVMELVEGGELFDAIVDNGSFTEPVARYVFLQIAEGLRYIHSKDIVHRDLKPENILVDGKASRSAFLEVKLSDFGHSKLINNGYSTALTRVGTPQYWAPEVSDPRKAAMGYDQTVDLWSLGVVLYVMLVGSYPFDGVGERIEDQMKKAHLTFRSHLGQELSEHAKHLIRSLMKVNPKDRLSLDQCLAHPWVCQEGGALCRIMKLSEDTSSRNLEERMTITTPLSKAKVTQIRTDLQTWEKKFKFSAIVKYQEVIVSYGDKTEVHSKHVELARSELQLILDHHFPPAAEGSYAPSLPTVQEGSVVGQDTGKRKTGTPFRLITHTLKVCKDSGAGLDLFAERGGMRISQIYDQPGQPGLQANDLIVKINEVPLRGSPEKVQQIFGYYFCDGVQIALKRERER